MFISIEIKDQPKISFYAVFYRVIQYIDADSTKSASFFQTNPLEKNLSYPIFPTSEL